MSKKLILFSAPWCTSCNQLKNKLNENNNFNLDLEIVDITKDIDMSIKYKIMSVPTIIKLEDGLETNRLVGNVSIKSLNNL